ncbi:MAG: hypothetical protein COB35_11605 [Gammaproteobacteria bacterium]|nr:MAG: hypothetical protein COB35_11605 [Gammaproteobacteria bacterium]
MWKALLFILIISTFSYTPVSFAANVSLSICEYVAVNDKRRLRSFLKSNKLKIRKIFKGLKCNGKNILIFAADKKSIATGEMIIGKLSKKIIKKNIDELGKYSEELLVAAKKRIE